MIAFRLGRSISEDVMLAYSSGCLKVEIAYFFKTVSVTHYLALV
jgi:hypothetical protein